MVAEAARVGIVGRVIRGGPGRKTRLHDTLGMTIPLSRMLRNGPRSLVSTVGRLAFGRRPVKPWISYDAAAELDAHLTKSSRVLEFGSGMSTVWYAERAGEVVSIEDYRPWYEKVVALFAARGIGNVRYRFAGTPDDYVAPTAEEAAEGFDLVMIDGSIRDSCVPAAIATVRAGGIIYLDNADFKDDPITGDCRRAAALLTGFANEIGGETERYTDFAPTYLYATAGLLVRVPATFRRAAAV